MRRLRREEAAPMGSQHLPLATLYLLELLGEYPFWGVCRGYLGLGYKREDASIRSLGLTQACMSLLWSIAEGWGHQDHCLVSSPGLALGSASPTTRAPPLLLSCTVGGLGTLLSPSRWNPPSDQALSLELKLSSSNSEPASLCSYPPSPLPYECPAFTWVPPGTGNAPSPGQFW